MNWDKILEMKFSHGKILPPLEIHSYENFWTQKDFEIHLCMPNCGGFVAYDGAKPIAFIAFEISLRDHMVFVWNLVVHTQYRRIGLGTALIKKVLEIANENNCIVRINTRETNLDVQFFLKSIGFKATHVERQYFVDELTTGIEIEDAFCFASVVRKKKEELVNE